MYKYTKKTGLPVFFVFNTSLWEMDKHDRYQIRQKFQSRCGGFL